MGPGMWRRQPRRTKVEALHYGDGTWVTLDGVSRQRVGDGAALSLSPGNSRQSERLTSTLPILSFCKSIYSARASSFLNPPR